MALPLIHVNARDRDRKRQQRGFWCGFAVWSSCFKTVYYAEHPILCVRFTYFFDFFSVVCFFCHRNEINLVDKFKSFLFRLILFSFVRATSLEFSYDSLFKPVIGREYVCKVFLKGFTRVDDSIVFVKLNSQRTSISLSFNLFNHSNYRLIWFCRYTPSFFYSGYRKKFAFDKKKMIFFFIFFFWLKTSIWNCAWNRINCDFKRKRNESFVKPKHGIKLNSWEDAASPFNLFGILYLWS